MASGEVLGVARAAPRAAPRRRARIGNTAPGLPQLLLLAPAQLLLVALILLPAIHIGWMSLQRASLSGETALVGFENYRTLFADHVFWRAAWNTFLVTNAVVCGEMILGLGFALLAAGWMPFRKVFMALLIAPYAINEVSAVAMWRFVLEPDIGMVNWAMMQVGLGQLDWSADPTDALVLASVLLVWMHTPFTFLILYAALLSVPQELKEAAMVDGASLMQTLVKVVLPLVLSGVMAAALFVIVYAWNEFIFALVFTTRVARTTPLVMSEMLSTTDGVDWGVLFAAATLQRAPVLAFILSAQRHVIAGLTAGAVKG
jgi:multiple sugar transport system permease protein